MLQVHNYWLWPPRWAGIAFGLEELGVDFLVPGVEFFPHGLGFVGHRFGEVFAFSDIFLEIVEGDGAVFVVFKEFEFAHSDGSAGDAALVGIVRVMPVKGITLEAIAFEGWGEVDAIDGMLDFSPDGCGDGGQEVDGAHHFLAGGAGLGDAGKADDPRFADTTFVDPTFSAAEWKIAGWAAFGGGESAVV